MALGLLDARVICGDVKVAEPVLEGARARWARQKPPWLDVLEAQVAERHATFGDVGFLLEPDLKEAHGGLRDITALLAMMQAMPVLADYVDTVAVDDARSVLTAIRVELHRRAGRELNKLLLQEQDQVASTLGEPDADALMRAVATAGRTVAWEGDDAWRRRGAWARSNGSRATRRLRRGRTGERSDEASASTGEADLGIGDDEVVLTDAADPSGDPSLALRLAAVAAERNLPVVTGRAQPARSQGARTSRTVAGRPARLPGPSARLGSPGRSPPSRPSTGAT